MRRGSRFLAAALCVILLAPSFSALAMEQEPFYSDSIDLTNLFGAASGELSEELGLTVIEAVSGVPVAIDDWDYVNVFNMRLQVHIAPITTGTGRVATITLPPGLRFATTSLPAGYSLALRDINNSTSDFSATFGRIALLGFPDNIGAGTSVSVELPITQQATGPAGPAPTQSEIALRVGTEIVERGKAGVTDFRFMITAEVGEVTAETYLLPRAYEYDNIFASAPYVVNNIGTAGWAAHAVQVTGHGVVGEMSGTTYFSFNSEYQLSNEVVHEPYWGLEVRYDIPSDFKMTNPVLEPYLQPDGQTLIFDNVNEGGYDAASANFITNGRNRMRSPLADRWECRYRGEDDATVPVSFTSTSFGTGMIAFGAVLNLEYRSDLYGGAPPPLVENGGEWAMPVTVTYQTRFGEQTQNFVMPIKTRPYTFDDNRLLFEFILIEGGSSSTKAAIDLKQGYEGATRAQGQEVLLRANTYAYNFTTEKHIGQTMLWEIGDYYDIKGLSLRSGFLTFTMLHHPAYPIPLTLGAVTYEYMPAGGTEPLLGTAVYDTGTNRYIFPDVQASGHVTKIWFELPNGIEFLGERWLHFFDLDVRVAQNIPSNTADPDTYKSTLTISLPDCDINANKHKKVLDVNLRGQPDILFGQARGGHRYPASSGTIANNAPDTIVENFSTYPNLTGEPYGSQAKVYAPVAKMIFGYPTFIYSGTPPMPNGYSAEPAKWRTYEDVSIQIANDAASARPLEMIWQVQANGGMLFTNGRFEYTTANEPGVVKTSNIASNGDPVDGTVNTGIVTTFNLPMDPGDYLTSLTFRADRFKALGANYRRREPKLLELGLSWTAISGYTCGIFYFYSRTDRAFPSDGVPVPDWSEETYPFNSLFSADGVPDKPVVTDTVLEDIQVGFSVDMPRNMRVFTTNAGFVDVPHISTVTFASAAAQGSVVTATLRVPITTSSSTDEENKVYRNAEIWVELGRDFVYAGLPTNVFQPHLTADMIRFETVNGKQYMVIKEEAKVTDARNYIFNLLVKPNAKLGANHVLAGAGSAPFAATHFASNSFRDITDSMNKAYASQFPPYTYLVWMYDSVQSANVNLSANDRLWVEESAARTAADFPGKQTVMVVNMSVHVTPLSESGLRVYPGADGNMMAGTQTVREGQANSLEGFATISAAHISQMQNAVAIIQIPSDGAAVPHSTGTAVPDFAMALRGPVSMEDLETEGGDIVTYTLTYSVTGENGPWVALPGDWAAVTHVKVELPILYAGHGVTVRMPLQMVDDFADVPEGSKSYMAGKISFTNVTTGNTMSNVLTVPAVFTVQRGAIQGGYVFQDNNGNHLYDATRGDVKLSGWSVRLFADGDLTNALATATTDANGYYSFGNLLAGDYVTQVVIPPTAVGYSFADTGDVSNPFASHVDEHGFSPVITLPDYRDADARDRTNAGLVKRLVLVYDKGVPASASGMPEPLVTTQLAGALVELAAAPTAFGYTFIGWKCDVGSCATCANPPYHQPFNGLEEEEANHYTMPSDDVIMTAMWDPDTMTVTFLPNAGGDPNVAGPNPTSKIVAFGAAYGELAAISRTGYQFDGWFTAPTVGSLVTAATIVSQIVDHDLYAQWTPNKHNITYAYTGTVPTGAPAEPSTQQNVSYGTTQTVANAPTMTGYTFSGWTTVDAVVSGGSFTMPDKDVAFTGSWSAKDVTVLFFNNHNATDITQYAAGNAANTGKKFNDLLSTFADPSRTGYTFQGWYTERSGGTKWTFATDRIATEGTLNLYAQWAADTVTVNFYNNHSAADVTQYATGNAANTGKKFNDLLSTFADPSRTGYTFQGWYTERSGGTKWTFATDRIATEGTLNLYAQWSADAVTVNFYNNHSAADVTQYATGNAANTGKKFNDLLTAFADPSRTGYTFQGWYTERSGGTKWTFATDRIATEGTLNLYAQWSADAVTVNFYNNHSAADVTQYATGNAANTGKKFDDLLSTFVDPSRTGYTFQGWYTERSGGTKWVFATDRIATEGTLNLYAQWSADAVTVNFYNNHSAADITQYATGNAANAGKKFGDLLSAFADPSRTGYTFQGWYTERADGSKWNFTTDRIATVGTLNLYAQWTADAVTVNFYNNHSAADVTQYATGNAANTGKKFNDLLSAFADPSRTGYTFQGWYTERSGGTKWNFTTDRIATVGTLNLYAQWSADAVTVNFYNNHSAADVTQYATGNAANVGKKFNDLLSTFADPSRTGYTFQGWYTERSGGTKWTFATDRIATAGTLNLYAQWTADAVTVNFYNNHSATDVTQYAIGNAANVGKKFNDLLSTFADPTRTGYTFQGWYTERSGGTKWAFATDRIATVGTLNLYAQWAADTVTVNFYNNHSAADVTQYEIGDAANTGKKFGDLLSAFADPTRTGYTFQGWYTERTDGSKWNFTTDRIATVGTLNLYAQWTVDAVTVIFYNNHSGEDNTQYETGNAANAGKKFDELLSTFADPTRTGYTFQGWYMQRADGSKWNFSSDRIATEGTLNLYAQWTADGVTVLFFNNHNNEDVTQYATGNAANTGKKFNDLLTAFADPTRMGYTFQGWYTERSGGAKWAFATNRIAAEGTLNLYAQWSADAVTVLFFNNHSATDITQYAIGNAANSGKKYDDLLDTFADPTRTGYTFQGWYTERSGGTKWNFATHRIATEGTLNLYAQWSADAATVRFYNNHSAMDDTRYATGEDANADKKFGDLLSAFADPTRTGYTFQGWYTERSGGTKWTFATDRIATEDTLNLYAQWTADAVTVNFYNNHSATDVTRYATGDTANVGKKFDDLLTAFADPARTGYTFQGWYTQRLGGTKWTFTTDRIATEGTLNLYAQWTADAVTVLFFNNHNNEDITQYETGNNANAGKKFGDILSAFDNPTRTGYTFQGWYDARTGGTRYIPGTSGIDVAGTLNLYAQWAADAVAVNFYNNHSATDITQYAIGNAANSGKKYDDLLDAFSDPTRTGYTFQGWYTQRSDGTKWAFATDRIATVGTLNLYAQWTADAVTVNFYNNHSAADVTQYATGNAANAGKKFDDLLSAFADPIRTGYTFQGWYTERTDGSKWAFATDRIATEGTLNLYAQWTADAVTVNFYNNHTATDVTRYTTGDTANAGKKFGDLLSAFSDPTRTGYTFQGWYTERSVGTKWNFATDRIATEGTLNLYAQWTADAVTVNFYNNHSAADVTRYAIGDTANASKKYDDLLDAFADPTRTGYTFQGWYTERSVGTKWNFATDRIATEGTLNLYAQWSADAATVRFYNNHDALDDTRYLVGEAANADKRFGDLLSAFADPTRTGYTFTGWYSVRSGGTKWDFGADRIATEGTLDLYAQWTADGVTVNFFNNHSAADVTRYAIGDAANAGKKYDDLLAAFADPTRTGYTFQGWYPQRSGGTKWNFATDKIATEGTLNLYAQWTADAVTVLFFNNHNSEDITQYAIGNDANTGKKFGDLLTTFADPTRTGYTFQGWYIARSGGAPWDFTTDTIATEATLNLYAQWSADGVTVNFFNNHNDADNSRYAIGETANAGKRFGDALTTFADPTRQGYTFTGWYSARSGGVMWNFATDKIATEGTLNLFAQWTRNTITILYDTNGSTEHPASAFTPAIGSTAALAYGKIGEGETGTPPYVHPGDPLRTGYAFAGWYTSQGAAAAKATGTAWVFATDTVDMHEGSMTLYAGWIANTNDISYGYTGAAPSGADAKLPLGETDVPFGAGRIVAPSPTLYGYHFSGWDTEDVTVDGGGNFNMPNNSVTFTGSWTAKNITISFFNNHDATDTSRYAPGETANAAKRFGEILADFTEPSRTGYTFTGWFTQRADGTEYTPGMSVIDTEGPLELYAQWSLNSHTITYSYTSAPAGAPTVPAAESVSFGVTRTVWQPGNLTGYTFSGWTATGTSATSGDFAMPDSNVTFTGSWTAKAVEVRFFNNHDALDTSRYDIGDAANAGKRFGEKLAGFTAPTRTGYDLVGWFTQRAGGAQYIPGTSVIDTEGPLELYAQWTPKLIQVLFFNNHSATDSTRYATGDAANVGKKFGDTLSAFADPVREQHDFIGWFTARSGGVEYVPGVSVIDTETTLSLYAQWVSNMVTIRYRANNPVMGTASPGSETLHKTLGIARGSTAQANPGYLFVNWTDSQGRIVSTDAIFVPAKVAGENVEATYTANFQEMDLVTIYYVAREGGAVYPTASRVNPVTGEPVRSTATPAPGYVFVNWTDAQGNEVSTGLSYRPRKAENELWKDGTTFYATFAPAGAGTITIPVTKVWDVPQGVTKLPNVTITLRRDGKPYRTLQLGGGRWSGQFSGVPKTAPNGSAYVYTVSENMLPGFTLTSVTGSAEAGFVLTNTARELTVTFVDWNGTVLKQQSVPYGGSATPPDDPSRDGHEFIGWIGRYENVTRNEYVYAKYGRIGIGAFTILDAAVPLAGGSVSNFGDCIE